jgi:hypothetical protein
MHTMEIETQETQNGISEIASPDHNAKIPAKNTDISAAAFQYLQKGQQNAKDLGNLKLIPLHMKNQNPLSNLTLI